MMRLGLYQNCPEFGQVERNVQQAIHELSRVEVDLMVLPELFSTGYQFASEQEVEALAEEIPAGETCRAMASLARSKKMSVVFGLAERHGKRLYNSAVVIGPDGFVGKYRKTHLFAEEKQLFDLGDSGFQVFDLGVARIGIMVCFDWWFPESARVLALLGADIICHPANLVLPNCQKAMAIRSLENGVFTVTANRVGTESRDGKTPLTFTGESQITDNRGRVMAKMTADEVGTLVTEVDPEEARNKSISYSNDRFRDRRPEFYIPLVNSMPESPGEEEGEMT